MAQVSDGAKVLRVRLLHSRGLNSKSYRTARFQVTVRMGNGKTTTHEGGACRLGRSFPRETYPELRRALGEAFAYNLYESE